MLGEDRWSPERSGSQHSSSEELKARPTVHHSLHELEPVDLALDLAVAPREENRREHGIAVAAKRRFWPNGDAIGKRVGYPYPSPWLTIVGVVPDTKQDSLSDTTSMSMYVPWQQRSRMSGGEMWVVARSDGDPSALGGTIRRLAHDVDRAVPVSDVRAIEAVISSSLQKARFTVLLVGAFAVAALLLGAVGIYGVMSYIVGQRDAGARSTSGARRATIRCDGTRRWTCGQNWPAAATSSVCSRHCSERRRWAHFYTGSPRPIHSRLSQSRCCFSSSPSLRATRRRSARRAPILSRRCVRTEVAPAATADTCRGSPLLSLRLTATANARDALLSATEPAAWLLADTSLGGASPSRTLGRPTVVLC
jgi:hypothetical protein